MVRVVASPRMASLTPLRLEDRALTLATFESTVDPEALPETADRIGGHMAMFGGGTSILVTDGELPVALVHCGMGEASAVIGEDGGLRLVRAGASIKLPRLLVWYVKHSLSGLESMAGVPGDVDGTVAGNTETHEMDTGTALRSVDALSLDRGFRTLRREDMCYGYRSLGLENGGKPRFTVSDIVLALRPAKPEAIRTALRDNIERKLQVQLARSWSAGCVFRNPLEGTSAGRLLDGVGFRGKRPGNTYSSEIHANLLVNEGKGSVDTTLKPIRSVQSAVWE